MNPFYLYPNRAVKCVGASPATSLALRLWQHTAPPTAQLRVLAASPEPIDVTVYDIEGDLLYQATASPNSSLPLDTISWPAGTYAVRVRQGTCTITQMLVREQNAAPENS